MIGKMIPYIGPRGDLLIERSLKRYFPSFLVYLSITQWVIENSRGQENTIFFALFYRVFLESVFTTILGDGNGR